MGYVKYDFTKFGIKVLLEVRGKKYEATVTELPFYKKNYVR
jgi:aminomethyltransferase